MKIKITLAILLLSSCNFLFAQRDFWENPSVFEKNMEPAHTVFNLYDTEDKAKADDTSESPYLTVAKREMQVFVCR